VFPLSTTEASGAVIHIEETTERVQIEELMVQSEKMLSVGGLAAGMAHEINNPLAAVLQNAQVLSQRLSPLLEKNRKIAQDAGINMEQLEVYIQQRGIAQILQGITLAGQRAARIVENMLSFSRKSTSRFLPRSLQDLLEQTMELAASDYDLKHNYDFRAIEIVREYQQVPDVPCEASQIQQVMLNLLKNSAHALKGMSDPHITLRIFPENHGVCLQVEDNGAGMDESVRRRVFEPFYTTKVVGAGTGLGLSVSYFIISENHQGSMSVASEPGKGSCFTILLPLQMVRKTSLSL
jgi:signal transduction histidine kinase